jgi:hypothetical protein
MNCSDRSRRAARDSDLPFVNLPSPSATGPHRVSRGFMFIEQTLLESVTLWNTSHKVAPKLNTVAPLHQ